MTGGVGWVRVFLNAGGTETDQMVQRSVRRESSSVDISFSSRLLKYRFYLRTV